MLESYWPSKGQIKDCIRTEAEELAEHVLLAVHEPMTLTRRIANSTGGERKTENNLLDHVLENERPIPIIGESGIGKSHLIRWLDAKLRVHPKSVDWHIRRIPKNASLGQVLEILLDGLEGDEFEVARKKIREVGERLNVSEVADHLIVFMSHRLDELWLKTDTEIKELRNNGLQPDEETKFRMKRIQRHAKKDALPALLGDSHYKKKLVGKGKCIYQIAKRLAKGSSDKELAASAYQMKVEDLDFKLNLGDLSREARDYVNYASLNTMSERRQEATDLLNEVLSEACRKTFQQLFQFHGGSFQELFTDIRRHLKKKNKTMVVLVEDMAAISAIEDVLIDSLMQEGMRDGVEELCSLRSAIAVTDGYSGYVRRRNTLATRARYEWYIDKYLHDSEETYCRIEDFCGRYLNAARHGKDTLEVDYNPNQAITEWPTIWHSSDAEEKELVEVFGVSKSGHPLFPYNSSSLRALADKYCSPNQELEFNPRKILGHILIDILTNYRSKFCSGEFPPVGFEDIPCPGTLAREIDSSVYEETERAQTVSAVWGYGAEDIKHLAGIMKPRIAQVFSLDGLSQVLDGTVPIKQTKNKREEPDNKRKGGDTETKNTEAGLLQQIPKDIDEWFKNKSIPQKYANVIRIKLVEHIQEYWKSNYSKWVGMKELPPLKRGNISLISIPYNTNNPAKTYASCGSEKEFKTSPLKYKAFMTALFRHVAMKGWNYDDGYIDYCTYINFIDEWTLDAISDIVEEKRNEIGKKITKHLSLAFVFDPGMGQRSQMEKITFLCASQDKLKEGILSTGIESWDNYREEIVSQWSDSQGAWLWDYAINNHALEGDMLQSALRGTGEREVPANTARVAQSAQKQLDEKYPALELLDGCTDQEEFIDTFNSLEALIGSLSNAAEYHGMEGELTARKYINRIKKLLNGDHWPSAKAFISLRKPFEAKMAIRSLNLIDSEKLADVNQLLTTWQKLYGINNPRMEVEMQSQGGDRRLERKNYIDLMLSNAKDVLNDLKEMSA